MHVTYICREKQMRQVRIESGHKAGMLRKGALKRTGGCGKRFPDSCSARRVHVDICIDRDGLDQHRRLNIRGKESAARSVHQIDILCTSEISIATWIESNCGGSCNDRVV